MFKNNLEPVFDFVESFVLRFVHTICGTVCSANFVVQSVCKIREKSGRKKLKNKVGADREEAAVLLEDALVLGTLRPVCNELFSTFGSG